MFEESNNFCEKHEKYRHASHETPTPTNHSQQITETPHPMGFNINKSTNLKLIYLFALASFAIANLVAQPDSGPIAGALAHDAPLQVKPGAVHFAEPPEGESNIKRVAAGRSVQFKCVVNNIGDHKLAWFHKDRRLLLALDNKTIAWRDRIHVSSQANSVFVLQIDSVQLSDKGHFVCQLNTLPVQSQVHILDVMKSPQIKEKETTISIEPVKEFQPVELRCSADGIPKPVIKWMRESQAFELPVYGDDAESEEANELELNENKESQEPAKASIVEKRAGDILGDLNSSRQMAPHLAAAGANIKDGGSDDDTALVDHALVSILSDVDSHEVGKTLVRRQVGGHAEEMSRAAEAQAAAANERAECTRTGDKCQEQKQIDSSREETGHNRDENQVHGSKQEPLHPPSGSSSAAVQTSKQRRLRARATAAVSAQTRAMVQSMDAAAAAHAGGGQSTSSSPPPLPIAKSFLAEGEVLRFDRVSRYDMGYYMCIASNGVPPSVSQRIFLPVSYVATRNTTRQAGANVDATAAGNLRRSKENNNNNSSNNNNYDNNSNNIGGSSSGGRTDDDNGRAGSHKNSRGESGSDLQPARINVVGSGRSYHKHRQLKAARSSYASSSAARTAVPSLPVWPTAVAAAAYCLLPNAKYALDLLMATLAQWIGRGSEFTMILDGNNCVAGDDTRTNCVDRNNISDGGLDLEFELGRHRLIDRTKSSIFITTTTTTTTETSTTSSRIDHLHILLLEIIVLLLLLKAVGFERAEPLVWRELGT